MSRENIPPVPASILNSFYDAGATKHRLVTILLSMHLNSFDTTLYACFSFHPSLCLSFCLFKWINAHFSIKFWLNYRQCRALCTKRSNTKHKTRIFNDARTYNFIFIHWVENSNWWRIVKGEAASSKPPAINPFTTISTTTTTEQHQLSNRTSPPLNRSEPWILQCIRSIISAIKKKIQFFLRH